MTRQLILNFAAILLLAHAKPSKEMTGPITCWNPWFNVDHAGPKGDYETLKALRDKYPRQICAEPEKIQAVTVSGEIPAEKTGQKFYAYNTKVGFICRNEDQISDRCRDYKVRFKCPCYLEG